MLARLVLDKTNIGDLTHFYIDTKQLKGYGMPKQGLGDVMGISMA